METPTLYQAMVDAGIPIDSHETDLYFLSSPHALAILGRYPNQKAIAKGFRSALDGKQWVEVPFAYDPGWRSLPPAPPKRIWGQG
jgi:hypothetical protein